MSAFHLPSPNLLGILKVVLVVISCSTPVAEAFAVTPTVLPRVGLEHRVSLSPYSAAAPKLRHLSALLVSLNRDSDDEDEELEYARVRRRGRGGRSYYEDDEADDGREEDGYSGQRQRGDIYDEDEDEFYDEEDDEEDEEDYNLFGNEIIPNPLLDSIDPDGAAERFPELARDPRFWFDMVLLLMFLDFLSFVGPQNPQLFPDLPVFS